MGLFLKKAISENFKNLPTKNLDIKSIQSYHLACSNLSPYEGSDLKWHIHILITGLTTLRVQMKDH